MKIRDMLKPKPKGGYSLMQLRRMAMHLELDMPSKAIETIGHITDKAGNIHLIQAIVLYDPKEGK
jgi:hypothetical protein